MTAQTDVGEMVIPNWICILGVTVTVEDGECAGLRHGHTPVNAAVFVTYTIMAMTLLGSSLKPVIDLLVGMVSDRCLHLQPSPLNCVDIHQISGYTTTVSTVAAAVTVGTRLPEQAFGVGGERSIIKNGSTHVTQSVGTVELQLLQVEVATLGQWVCTSLGVQRSTMETALLQHATLRFGHGFVLMAIAQPQFISNLASLQFQDIVPTAS